jgi:spore germination protein YaaH
MARRGTGLIGGVAGAAFALAAMALAGDISVGGWLPTTWDYGNSFASFAYNAAALGQVSPVWYWAGDDGGVVARLPGGVSGAEPGPCEAEVREVCRACGVKLIPLISNSGPGRGFDAGLVGRIVNSPSLSASHIRALTRLAVERGYDGMEIDYEMLKSADRDAFSRFVAGLSASLHREGKLLAIAVHPKTSEPGDDWGPGAHDYGALGRSVDIFRVMAYDNHWLSGKPGPVAPLPWFREVLSFTVSMVPAGKVQMGIPTYGYDWPRGGGPGARDVTAREVPELALSHGTRTEWDPASSSPLVRYRDAGGEREAWYEDGRCLGPKVEAVRKAGGMGIAIWRLGSEDGEFWEELARARRGG